MNTPKQETPEEAAERIYGSDESKDVEYYAFINGAKWQQEQDKNKYSENDMISFMQFIISQESLKNTSGASVTTAKYYLKKFLKKHNSETK
jgi:hypothetical protein